MTGKNTAPAAGKKTLKQTAYEYIKDKILTCAYSPGTFLNEQQLCDEMGGLSRTPVRDALGRLEQEGLVNIHPKRGVAVAEIRLSDINRIYEVRLLLEPYALRRYGSRISKPELQRMKKLLSSTDRAYRDFSYYYDLDDRLHQLIVESMSNRYLLDTYENIRNLDRRFRVLTGDGVENRIQQTFEEHLAIVDAALAEDWERSAAAMQTHLENARLAAFRLMVDSQENDRV